MRFRLRAARFFLCFLLSLLVLTGARPWAQTAAPPAPTAAYTSNPQFQAAMTEAATLAKHKRFGFAADSYKKANKIAGGECFPCLRGLYSAQLGDHDFKSAVGTASSLEALCTEATCRSLAEYMRAEAMLYGAGSKPKQEKLEAVHGVLLESLGNFKKNPAALFLDGRVLALMGKMDEAKVDFQECVQCAGPKDPAHLRAEHFAENPELSLHKMAPPFEVDALDGSRFNLDAMGGRVVLIDFWATWCGPCNAELPHMRQIAKEFAGQPLVILSISWDNDEAKWKDFVAKNGMTWAQYRDADHALAEMFGINNIPHYFTIDSDGVLTSEMVGTGADIEGRLRKLLVKAREAQKETAAASPSEVSAAR